MLKIRKSKFFNFIFVLTICSALLAALVYYFSIERGPIYAFDSARDTKPILELFDKNWYWLVASSREEYCPKFTLKHKTPDKDPRNFGKLIIKVIHEDELLAGFSAYYKKNFYEGFLLFLAVDKKFRGKGYGEKLARYAINDLFNRGCLVIKLVTRTDNLRAIKLYNKIGFTETSRDDTFVYFEIRKK